MRLIYNIIKMRASMSGKKIKVRKIHLIQVTVLTAMSFLIMTTVFAEGASIYLDVANPRVSQNEEFTVSIKIDSVSDLSAYQFDLNYNPKNYEIVSVVEGSFLNSNGTDSTFFLGPLDSSRRNTITFASTRMGSISGVDGMGILVEITFRAKTAGKVKINVVKKSVNLLDSNGQNIQ